MFEPREWYAAGGPERAQRTNERKDERETPVHVLDASLPGFVAAGNQCL